MELVKLLTAEELSRYFDKPGDHGDFVLDLKAAREERAGELSEEALDERARRAGLKSENTGVGIERGRTDLL